MRALTLVLVAALTACAPAATEPATQGAPRARPYEWERAHGDLRWVGAGRDMSVYAIAVNGAECVIASGSAGTAVSCAPRTRVEAGR